MIAGNNNNSKKEQRYLMLTLASRCSFVPSSLLKRQSHKMAKHTQTHSVHAAESIQKAEVLVRNKVAL